MREKEWVAVTAQQAEQRRQTTLNAERRELDTLKQLLEDVPEGPV